MALIARAVMLPTGTLLKHQKHRQRYPSLEEDDADLDTAEQRACVFVVSGGMASHWATIWIFENGETFGVELDAVDGDGCRWITNQISLHRIPSTPKPDEELSDESDPCLSQMRLLCPNGPQEAPVTKLWDKQRKHSTMNILKSIPMQLPHEHVKRKVLDDVCNYIEEFDYTEVSSPIRLKRPTTPREVLERANHTPLKEAFYDLLFHNCQLFVVTLLCDEYGVEFHELPLSIGAIAAAPVMLLMEVLFIGLFAGLLKCGKPAEAVYAGLLWIALEILFTSLYLRRQMSNLAKLNMDFTGYHLAQSGITFGVLGSLVAMILSPSLSVDHIPLLTLLWDLGLTHEAMKANHVFKSVSLMVANICSVVASCYVVCLVQWWNSWPFGHLVVVSLAFLLFASFVWFHGTLSGVHHASALAHAHHLTAATPHAPASVAAVAEKATAAVVATGHASTCTAHAAHVAASSQTLLAAGHASAGTAHAANAALIAAGHAAAASGTHAAHGGCAAAVAALLPCATGLCALCACSTCGILMLCLLSDLLYVLVVVNPE